MASLFGPSNPFPPALNRRTDSKTTSSFDQPANIVIERGERKRMILVDKDKDKDKVKKREEIERKEQVNNKIASHKAISIILRREATKAVIEKKRGTNSKKLLPRTVLEALHERITALRWESALKVKFLNFLFV